jgi:DNA-binding NarL/FixJ family response regulator
MSFNHCESFGISYEPPRPGAPHLDGAVRMTRLTMREREVLRRITDGQSTSQIAKDLAIASSTARTHANNVLVKLGARSRIQAAATASPPPLPIVAPAEPDPLSALTRRERDVLVCMVEGLPQVAIAERLCLSPNTVRTHARNILNKLGVHSTLEAAALVRRLTTGPPDMHPDRHAPDIHPPDRRRDAGVHARDHHALELYARDLHPPDRHVLQLYL